MIARAESVQNWLENITYQMNNMVRRGVSDSCGVGEGVREMRGLKGRVGERGGRRLCMGQSLSVVGIETHAGAKIAQNAEAFVGRSVLVWAMWLIDDLCSPTSSRRRSSRGERLSWLLIGDCTDGLDS